MKHRLRMWFSWLALASFVASCSPATGPPKTAGDASSRQAAQAPGGSGASSQPASPGESAAPAGGETTATDRMIVYNMQMSMEVADTTDAMEKVAGIAQTQGGYVVSSNFHYEQDRKLATVTIRVPSLNYQFTLGELRRLATKVQNEDSKSQDVTQEYTDLGAQLRNLEATETQYLDLLKKAQNTDDILKIQGRISDTRKEIERIKGRMVYLERTTDMASITISMFTNVAEKADPKTGLPAGWKKVTDAFEQSFVFLGNLATVLGMIIAFTWWLLLIGGVVAIALRIRRQWRARRPSSSATQGD
ncbi:MAG: DUF4349 domain-containing protein [Dehalococcoidia bacterium]|nr:DUF4349 domain-containing protein [Dehalococcoidia bacterium]